MEKAEFMRAVRDNLTAAEQVCFASSHVASALLCKLLAALLILTALLVTLGLLGAIMQHSSHLGELN